jgi:hypothetical protein
MRDWMMKRVGAAGAIALMLLVGGCGTLRGGAGVAGDELRRMADAETYLCSAPDPEQASCDQITRWRTLPDGRFWEFNVTRVDPARDLYLVLHVFPQVEGDWLCARYRDYGPEGEVRLRGDTTLEFYTFIPAARRIEEAPSRLMRQVEAMNADRHGRWACNRYRRSRDGRLLEQAWIDGRRAKGRDGVYSIHASQNGLSLRTQADTPLPGAEEVEAAPAPPLRKLGQSR